ncbi:MAG: hypothetical protein GWN32_11250, partial [Gemmatimonadetes bacterium]|nr:hypothetical protein [Gemmatimonadota bacterium]
MLELRTLGLLDIRGPDGETLQSVLSQPKRLALLAYLAAATPRRFHRRDTLLALFWPELDDRHARGALRQALTYLRRELGEGVVLSRGMEEVGIDAAALRCDAHTFESALEDGDEQTALELYKGTFLEGFHVSDVAPEFDRWIETERRRLRRHAVEAAWRLAEGCRDSGDWAAAKLWANRAFSFAASDESQLQRLVTLLDRIGDRAAALRAYEEFAQRLARDLDAEPSPETQALIQAVRSRAADRSEEDASAGLAPAAEATALSQTPDGPRRGRRITMRLAALLAGAALVTLVVAAVATMPGRGASLKPERVVVSSLRNRTGDPELDPVGQMASDWITQGLVRSGLVDVVPPTTALLSSRLLAEPTNDGGEVDSGGRVRSLAEETKAGIVVWGSYYVNGDSLYFVAQISDATDNEMVAGIDPIGTPIEDPLPGIETLRQRVMGALGVLFNARLAVLATETVQPPTFAAYREYAVGLEHFFRREFEEAARHFHHAA